MDRYITEDFSSKIFGVNTVTLRRWPSVNINTDPEVWRARLRRPRITFDDAERIRERLRVPATVLVESETGGNVTADNGREVTNVRITGASPEIFQVRNLTLARGRPFSPQEAEKGVAVVVLGSGTAEELFGDLDPLGRRVRVRGFPYRVVGVLEPQGSLFGQSLDNRVIAPARSPIQAITNPHGVVDQVVIQVHDPTRLSEAQSELEGIMRASRRLRPSQEDDFTLETAAESLSFWDKISHILFIALPGLVAISLVVGGIVIMNIMLVSVMERTREIGVRKAIGARHRDILTQVLIESATLSTVGALIGVGIGAAITALVRVASPLPAVVAPQWVALGVAVGVGVGVVAGVYPASRAARSESRRRPASRMSVPGRTVATPGPDQPRRGLRLETLNEGVRIALDALRANKVRSSLTILGVAVGVSVVVTMAALITGIRGTIFQAFESAGPNNFIVMRFDFTAVRIVTDNGRPPWWNKPVVTPEEAERIGELPGIEASLYNMGGLVDAEFQGQRVSGIQSQGYSSGWPRYTTGDFIAGRDFTPAEVRQSRAVAVLSAALATDLFGQRDPIGRRVSLSNPQGTRAEFTVIGVFQPEENIFTSAVKHWVVFPYTAGLKRLKLSDEQAQILVVPRPGVGLREAQDQVIGALRASRGLRPREENDFALVASSQILDTFNQLTGVFFAVMLGLSSAGLMVGGVGVIGIMLISVTERTREIGVRKAVGATRREILLQFLVEAAVLTVLGGAVGLALGGALAWGVQALTPVPADIPLWSVAAALGMAALTGMLFGLLPALRASRLEPVVALRAE